MALPELRAHKAQPELMEPMEQTEQMELQALLDLKAQQVRQAPLEQQVLQALMDLMVQQQQSLLERSQQALQGLLLL